jgi:hypothetical protein
VLLTTGSFILVYVLSTAAAVRILPRGSRSRRGAVVAFVAVMLLLVTTGIYMLWTLVIAIAALLYEPRPPSRTPLHPWRTPRPVRTSTNRVESRDHAM